MKANKIIYWIATGLFSLMITASVILKYFGDHENMVKVIEGLHFPGWLLIPLGIAKLLGIIAILTKKSEYLKTMAYHGFFFNLLLAIGAHVAVGDGQWFGAAMALTLLIISRVMDYKVFPKEA